VGRSGDPRDGPHPPRVRRPELNPAIAAMTGLMTAPRPGRPGVRHGRLTERSIGPATPPIHARAGFADARPSSLSRQRTESSQRGARGCKGWRSLNSWGFKNSKFAEPSRPKIVRVIVRPIGRLTDPLRVSDPWSGARLHWVRSRPGGAKRQHPRLSAWVLRGVNPVCKKVVGARLCRRLPGRLSVLGGLPLPVKEGTDRRRHGRECADDPAGHRCPDERPLGRSSRPWLWPRSVRV
jgi:hypothetical protein